MKNLLMPATSILALMAFAPADEAGAAPADEAPAPAEAKPAKEKLPPLVSQNNVSQPREGTKTRAVWDTADVISSNAGRPALRSEVMDHLLAQGMSKGTIATQYGKWCTFHAVSAEARREAAADKKAAAAEANAAETADAPADAPEAAAAE